MAKRQLVVVARAPLRPAATKRKMKPRRPTRKKAAAAKKAEKPVRAAGGKKPPKKRSPTRAKPAPRRAKKVLVEEAPAVNAPAAGHAWVCISERGTSFRHAPEWGARLPRGSTHGFVPKDSRGSIGAVSACGEYVRDVTTQLWLALRAPSGQTLIRTCAAGDVADPRRKRANKKAAPSSMASQFDRLNLEESTGGGRYHGLEAVPQPPPEQLQAPPPKRARTRAEPVDPRAAAAAAAFYDEGPGLAEEGPSPAPAAPPPPRDRRSDTLRMAEVRLMLRSLPEESKPSGHALGDDAIISAGANGAVVPHGSGFSTWSGRGRHLLSGVVDFLGPAPATIGLSVLVYRNGALVEPDDVAVRLSGKTRESLKQFLAFDRNPSLVAELHDALTADPSPPAPVVEDPGRAAFYAGARKRQREEEAERQAEVRRKWEQEQADKVPRFITDFVASLNLRIGGGVPHTNVNFVDHSKESLRPEDMPGAITKTFIKCRSGPAGSAALPPYSLCLPSRSIPDRRGKTVQLRLRGASGDVRVVKADIAWTLGDLRSSLQQEDPENPLDPDAAFATVAPFKLLHDVTPIRRAAPRNSLLQMVPLPPARAITTAPPATPGGPPRRQRAWWPEWITQDAQLVARRHGQVPVPVVSKTLFPWTTALEDPAARRRRGQRERRDDGVGTRAEPFDVDAAPPTPQAQPVGMSADEAAALAKQRRREIMGETNDPFPRWEDDSGAFQQHWNGVLADFKKSSAEGASFDCPTILTPAERHALHKLAEEAGLRHESKGQGKDRCMVISNLKPLPPPRPRPVYCGVNVHMHKQVIAEKMLAQSSYPGWDALTGEGFTVPEPLHITTYFRTEMDDAVLDSAEQLDGRSVPVRVQSLVIGQGGIVIAVAEICDAAVPVPADKLQHITLATRQPWAPRDSNDVLAAIPTKGQKPYSGTVTVLDQVLEIEVVQLTEPLALEGVFYRHWGARGKPREGGDKEPEKRRQDTYGVSFGGRQVTAPERLGNSASTEAKEPSEKKAGKTPRKTPTKEAAATPRKTPRKTPRRDKTPRKDQAAVSGPQEGTPPKEDPKPAQSKQPTPRKDREDSKTPRKPAEKTGQKRKAADDAAGPAKRKATGKKIVKVVKKPKPGGKKAAAPQAKPAMPSMVVSFD